MELTRIRSFVVLAERLHFGQTARLLNLSQPALSKQIRQLEEEIGAPLFNRGRHGTSLTEVGKLFAAEARLLVRQADATLERGRRAARGEVGRFTVGFGFSTVTLVPRIISKFRKRHSEVEVEMRDMSTPEQIEALRAGQLDVGFVRLPVSRQFRQRLVLEDRLVLVVPLSHEMTNSAGELSSLSEAPFIMLTRDQSLSLYDHILRVCGKHGFHPRVVQEANEFPTILALVAAGLGVAIVPESQLRTRIEGVRMQPIKDRSASWRVGAVWRPSQGDPLTADFIEILADEVQPAQQHNPPKER